MWSCVPRGTVAGIWRRSCCRGSGPKAAAMSVFHVEQRAQRNRGMAVAGGGGEYERRARRMCLATASGVALFVAQLPGTPSTGPRAGRCSTWNSDAARHYRGNGTIHEAEFAPVFYVERSSAPAPVRPSPTYKEKTA